jgi:hypothetical protein
MKHITRIGQALLALSLLSASAHAVSISGAIAFGGEFTQNGGTQGNLLTATSFSITSVVVISDSGTFNNATNPTYLSPIAYNGTSFNGNPTLWTITAGGSNFSFVVNTWAKITDTADTQVFQGTGTADDAGALFDATPGEWQLSLGSSAVDGQVAFSWQSTTAVGGRVPDGGSTVALLGVTLAAFALVRRRFVC